jgi:hypothetical protein
LTGSEGRIEEGMEWGTEGEGMGPEHGDDDGEVKRICGESHSERTMHDNSAIWMEIDTIESIESVEQEGPSSKRCILVFRDLPRLPECYFPSRPPATKPIPVCRK